VSITYSNTGRRAVKIARVYISAPFRYWGPSAPFYIKAGQQLKVSVPMGM
jgi:hypothetical protein